MLGWKHQLKGQFKRVNFHFSLLVFISSKCWILTLVIFIWVPGLLWPLFGEREENSERLDEKRFTTPFPFHPCYQPFLWGDPSSLIPYLWHRVSPKPICKAIHEPFTRFWRVICKLPRSWQTLKPESPRLDTFQQQGTEIWSFCPGKQVSSWNYQHHSKITK